MGDLAALLANTPNPKVAGKVPDEWEPGLTWKSTKGEGTITTGPLEREPDEAMWKDLISDWGLDPKLHYIVDDSMELIGWDGQRPEDRGTVRLKRYKVKIKRLPEGVRRELST